MQDRGESRLKNATGYSEGVSCFEINTPCLFFPVNKKTQSVGGAAFSAHSLHLYGFCRDIAIEGMQEFKML